MVGVMGGRQHLLIPTDGNEEGTAKSPLDFLADAARSSTPSV